MGSTIGQRIDYNGVGALSYTHALRAYFSSNLSRNLFAPMRWKRRCLAISLIWMSHDFVTSVDFYLLVRLPVSQIFSLSIRRF